VYFAPFGDIYRLPDGKLLLSDPLLSQQPPCWDQKNEMLFKHVHNDGLYGYKVLLDGETAKIEKKWGIPNVGKFTPDPRYLMKNCSQEHASVSFNDRTYIAGSIYHCTTGDVLAGGDWNPKSKIIDHVTGKEKTPTHEHAVKDHATPATRMQCLLADGRVYGVVADMVDRKPYWKDMSVHSRATVQIFSVEGKKLNEGHVSQPPYDHPAMKRMHEQGIYADYFSMAGSFSIGQDALYVRGVTHLWCLSEK
jgi:hypothetical protein